MSGFKFLIDTNIVIGLEDAHPVKAPFAELIRKCSERGIRIFVDEAVYDDIGRDKNSARRAITLSKLAKFERLRGLPSPPIDALAAEFGPISRENDHCDVRLLLGLKSKAVDFLVTEDADLHRRADRVSLGPNVLTVEEALGWIRTTFEPLEVSLPFVIEKTAYQIDRKDPIFESLRAGYPDFDAWFDKCAREHRPCWVVEIDGQLAGLVIRKDETHADAKTHHPGPKILKICTFKMKPEFRGEKFGEQLLKQILWFAQRNGYDLVYLTTFPDQEFLIEMLRAYGFIETGKNIRGEHILEKPLIKGLIEPNESDAITLARRYYPRFWIGDEVRKFCVPIQASYHQKLFPELAAPPDLPLFPESVFGRTHLYPHRAERIPGNTIRKVYLCRAKTRALRPGDLLFFYMSKDGWHRASQSITSVGVVEQVTEATNLDDLLRMTAKRSVFSEADLKELVAQSPSTPIKVIDFLLTGHLDPPVTLQTLLACNVFNRRPPQSIAELPLDRFAALRSHLNLGFAL